MFVYSKLVRNSSNESSNSFARTHHMKMELLPATFVVGANDVLCGRGARCYNHIGNKRFRDLVEQYVPQYSSSTASKMDKTEIIWEIITTIRSRVDSSTGKGGSFIREDLESGRYYEVGDFLAREKTSHTFRDILNAESRKKSVNETRQNQQHEVSSPVLGTSTPVGSPVNVPQLTLKTRQGNFPNSFASNRGTITKGCFNYNNYDLQNPSSIDVGSQMDALKVQRLLLLQQQQRLLNSYEGLSSNSFAMPTENLQFIHSQKQEFLPSQQMQLNGRSHLRGYASLPNGIENSLLSAETHRLGASMPNTDVGDLKLSADMNIPEATHLATAIFNSFSSIASNLNQGGVPNGNGFNDATATGNANFNFDTIGEIQIPEDLLLQLKFHSLASNLCSMSTLSEAGTTSWAGSESNTNHLFQMYGSKSIDKTHQESHSNKNTTSSLSNEQVSPVLSSSGSNPNKTSIACGKKNSLLEKFLLQVENTGNDTTTSSRTNFAPKSKSIFVARSA